MGRSKAMKEKRVWIILALVFTVILTTGTVAALMFRQTRELENQFDFARVSCELHETFDGTEKTAISVKNTGNIDAYIRVKLVTYWVQPQEDGTNIIVARTPAPELSVTLGEDWIVIGENMYFYTKPVPADESTSNLLAQNLILQQLDDGCLQVVEVFAEAIQSKPESAVKSAWGV